MENYHFGVECNWDDGKRHFRLNLSRDNIGFLLQECPELECISGGLFEKEVMNKLKVI